MLHRERRYKRAWCVGLLLTDVIYLEILLRVTLGQRLLTPGLAGRLCMAAALAGDRNFLNSVLDVVLFRTSATDIRNQSIPRLGALQYSIYELLSKQNIKYLLLIYVVFLLVVLVVKKRGISIKDIVRVLPFLFPVFIAAAWVMLLSNHTVIHILFTYRTVAPIVFSMLVFLSSTVESKEPQLVE